MRPQGGRDVVVGSGGPGHGEVERREAGEAQAMPGEQLVAGRAHMGHAIRIGSDGRDSR